MSIALCTEITLLKEGGGGGGDFVRQFRIQIKVLGLEKKGLKKIRKPVDYCPNFPLTRTQIKVREKQISTTLVGFTLETGVTTSDSIPVRGL